MYVAYISFLLACSVLALGHDTLKLYSKGGIKRASLQVVKTTSSWSWSCQGDLETSSSRYTMDLQ